MPRLPSIVSGTSRLLVVASIVLAAGCGSSEPPQAYPGKPTDPPREDTSLLDMMAGTSSPATAEPTATAEATAAPTAEPTATATATASAAAPPKKPQPKK